MRRPIRVGIINDTRNAHHMGCALVMKNLFRLLRQQDMRVRWRWPTGRDWREDRRLHCRGDVDLVLVNAEGSIHDSHEHHLAERFASIAHEFRSRFEIPCVLANATLYNNEPHIYELLRNYSRIYTRDTSSARILASENISATAVSDLTLALPLALVNVAAADATPMVTDSACAITSQELRELAGRIGGDYNAVQFARFPHANRLEKPRVYLGLARRWALDKARHRPGLNSFIKRICNKSLVITGRYHVVTMCLLTRTPFLAVESLIPKISWLLRDVFGHSDRVFADVSDLERNGNLSESKWTDEELSCLHSYLASCQQANQVMLGQIRDLALHKA